MKKKVLTLVAMIAIGLTSCKKDELVKPLKVPSNKVADKSNVGTWD